MNFQKETIKLRYYLENQQMSNKQYKQEVGQIIRDAMINYIALGNPDELEFRLWLGERKHYYLARFENIIVPKNYPDNILIIAALQEQIDIVKETAFKQLKPLQPEAEIINLMNSEN